MTRSAERSVIFPATQRPRSGPTPDPMIHPTCGILAAWDPFGVAQANGVVFSCWAPRPDP